jgi:electron transfer flavoprotein beta subunit
MRMKILVCLKQVPDTMEVKLSGDYTLEREFVAQVTNLADESALELGLSLRDEHGGAVTVLTMGPERAETMLREALSRGADDAVLLTSPAFAGADTLVTARCLSAAIRTLGEFDLILCGRRASDGETGQVGPMLASMMQLPCVVNAVGAAADGNELRIDQLTEDGVVTWKAVLPALITLCEWSYRLRLPSMPGLRKAKTAEIRRLTPPDIGVDRCGIAASPTRVVRVSPCPLGLRPCRKMSVGSVMDALSKTGLLP